MCRLTSVLEIGISHFSGRLCSFDMNLDKWCHLLDSKLLSARKISSNYFVLASTYELGSMLYNCYYYRSSKIVQISKVRSIVSQFERYLQNINKNHRFELNYVTQIRGFIIEALLATSAIAVCWSIPQTKNIKFIQKIREQFQSLLLQARSLKITEFECPGKIKSCMCSLLIVLKYRITSR